MLGDAIVGDVEPDAFVWQSSRGALLDALWGRDVLFVGAHQGQPRDLFRATVRVSGDGRPIVARRVHNLTETSIGDEQQLVARGHHAAFLTRAFGVLQGVTVLELSGAGLAELDLFDRLLAGLGGWFQTGSTVGLQRTEVVFGERLADVRLQLRDGMLVMALGDPPTPAALTLQDATLDMGRDGGDIATAWTLPRTPPKAGDLAVSLVTAVLSNEAVDALRELVDRARSGWLRLGSTAAGTPASATPLPRRDLGWPPEPLAPVVDPMLDGEGIWEPIDTEEHSRLYQTQLRPDAERAGERVHLYAMDMRRLSLGIVAGYDTPRPSTGPRASGVAPQVQPIVATLSGAGDGGAIVVDRRLLRPPLAGKATVAVDTEGRTHLGRWPETTPDDVVTLRQQGELVIADGVVAVSDDDLLDERRGLCRTHDGHLVYGHGHAISRRVLALGMRRAGCQDALRLAVGQGDGFVASPKELGRRAHDYLFFTAREGVPAFGGLTWTRDNGAQPLPTWLPAVHLATTEAFGVQVRLRSFDADRFEWHIRPGSKEKAGRTAERALTDEEHATTLVAIGLGVGARKTNRRGLVLDGISSLPIRPQLAVLSAAPDGRFNLQRSLEAMAPEGDASELPQLVEGGQIRSEARRLGAHRQRSAACLMPDRTLLLAMATCDSSEPLAVVLQQLGCRRVAELNRGKQIEAFVHRAGTEDPPQASYNATTLYGTSAPPRGRALRLP